MTWVDWAIVIVVVGSALGGLVQGFFRTACSLAGLLFGLSLAAWNYQRVAARLMHVVRIETIADAIAFFLIALVVMAIFHLLGAILGHAFKWLGLGCINSLAGGVLGLLQGLGLVMLVLLVTVAFFPRAHWLTDSRLPRRFFGALHVSTRITPEELAERLRKGLRLLEQETPPWMHPEKNST